MTDQETPSGNLFAHRPAPAEGEVFEDLLRWRHVRIERILSSERPDTRLYDQVQDEWICLLRGEATLWIEGETIHLKAGDYRFIPAHSPHRVLRTSREPPCLWLTLHLYPEATPDEEAS